MKRLSIALAAIGLSASVGAFAALPATTDPALINIPQLPGGFFLGASGYYLQPSDMHNDLAYAVVNTGTSPSFNLHQKKIDPGYDWGWGVNVGYIFPNTGNDVNLSYFQLQTDDSDSVTGTQLNIINPQMSSALQIFGEWTSARAKAEYDIDQVDLTAGQFINIGCRLIVHPFTGLRWAQLDREIDGTYNGVSTSEPLNETVNTKEESDYWGVGPIVGVDASYYIVYGFGAVGHFDSAVLVGNSDYKINTTTFITPSATPLFAHNEFKTDDTTRVIPVVDAKLGLDYTYIFFNTANSDLTLEVGWQFTHYFNAVDRGYASDVGGPGEGIAIRDTIDVGLNGPYASLVLHI